MSLCIVLDILWYGQISTVFTELLQIASLNRSDVVSCKVLKLNAESPSPTCAEKSPWTESKPLGGIFKS